MKYKPNYFKESKPIKSFKWVMDNCTVKVTTEEQRDFISSQFGQLLMDQLFDSPNREQYLQTARQIEEIMESLSESYNSSFGSHN